jgi:surface antigen
VKFEGIFIAALAVFATGQYPVAAQQNAPAVPAGPALDPNGYYNPFDPNGYFDRNGQYHLMRPGAPGAPGAAAPGPVGPPPAAFFPAASYGPFYEEGRYEQDCRRGTAVAGTIFPSTGGGLFGGDNRRGASGGVVLSGSLQKPIAAEIDCDDQVEAFGAFAAGLNGDVGRQRVWHGDGFGEFTVTREFKRGDQTCRDFTERSYRNGSTSNHKGTACMAADRQWRFD